MTAFLDLSVGAGQHLLIHSLAEPPPIWISYSWLGQDAAFVPPLVVGDINNPVATAAAMAARPTGKRGLIIQLLGHGLIGDAADKVTCPVDSQPYSGLWLGGGIATVSASWTTWLNSFKAAGGSIDRLAIDNEDGIDIFSFTYKGGPLPANQLIAIVDDPRYIAAIADGKAPNFTVQGYIDGENGINNPGSAIYFTPSAQALFNQYCSSLFLPALEAAIVGPLVSLFPAVKASQYNNAVQSGQVPDTNGFLPLNYYVKVGTDQSPFFYGAGVNAATPFGSLLYSINWFSQSVGSENDPITPWLGEPAADTTGILATTPYWDEVVHHAGMIGQQILFFSPSQLPADTTRFNAARQALYNKAQGTAFVATALFSPAAYDVNFIATGARFANGSTVYRITFAPGVTSAVFNGHTVTPDPGGVGTWVVAQA